MVTGIVMFVVGVGVGAAGAVYKDQLKDYLVKKYEELKAKVKK